MTKGYGLDSINVLSAIEHIRTRPGMYVGDVDVPNHLANEAFDNGLDEMMNGYANYIEIDLDRVNNRITFKDNGRGIPIGKLEYQNKKEEALHVLCTVPYSGGKFHHNSFKIACLHGDTLIKLVDRRDLSIVGIIQELREGKELYAYASKPDGTPLIQRIIAGAQTGLTKELLEVTLDNDEKILCTPDHRFMMRDGEYRRAEYLVEGDSLMPGYFRLTGEDIQELAKVRNHKVKSIKRISYDQHIPVYDLSMEGEPNFLLNAGVIVHNSGTHGVGLTAMNALSSSMIIETRRRDSKNHIHFVRCSYSRGELLEMEKGKKEGKHEETGVTVSLIADDNIYKSIIFDKNYIVNRVRIAKSFGYNIILRIDGEEVEIEADGLKTLLPDDTYQFQQIAEIEIKSLEKKSGESVQLRMHYTSDNRCKNKAFTNMLYNSAGGTHVNVFQEAIQEVWNPYLKDRTIELKDTLLGLRYCIIAFIEEIAFSSQTKERLTVDKNNFNKLLVQFKKDMSAYLEQNPDIRLSLLERFEEYRIAQNKINNKKEIHNIVKIGQISNGMVRRKSLIPELKECQSPYVEGTEVAYCEGRSAAGSLVKARDPKIHAILPLRGKSKNVVGLDPKTALENKEIHAMVTTAGTGILEECDVSKARYERFLILPDADCDGAQIAALLIGFFVYLMPNLVKAGKVFVVEAPLYGWVDKKTKKKKYAYHKDEIPNGIEFRRFKGLGEMNPDELYTVAFDKDNRRLRQVIYPTDLKAFHSIMKEASYRFQMWEKLGVIIPRGKLKEQMVI